MILEKSSIKKLIDSNRQNEMLVILINSLEMNSYEKNHREIKSFIKKNKDYVIIVVTR